MKDHMCPNLNVREGVINIQGEGGLPIFSPSGAEYHPYPHSWPIPSVPQKNAEAQYRVHTVHSPSQGVIFPTGVRVYPAGNLQNPQEILTKTLIIEQIL